MLTIDEFRSTSDVRHILTVAAKHFDELVTLGRSSMAEHKVTTTDAEIEAALKTAKLHENEPLATTVAHILDLHLLIIGLSNHRPLVLPIEDIQGLGGATHQQLQNYELLGHGTGISFPDLDVDLYVPALIAGVYGNRRWMAHLGKKGGEANPQPSARPRKPTASRAEGREKLLHNCLALSGVLCFA